MIIQNVKTKDKTIIYRKNQLKISFISTSAWFNCLLNICIIYHTCIFLHMDKLKSPKNILTKGAVSANYHRILSYFVNINIYWEHLFCTKSSQYWCQKMLEKFMMYPIHQSWLKLFIAWLGKLTMLNSVLYRQSQSRREHNCQVLFPFRSILYCIHNWMNWIWSIFPMRLYTYSTRYSKLELTLFI